MPVPGSDPPSPGVYAVSVAGVRPTTCTSWFQATQACRLAGKRLVRNDQWQDAAAGTPDPGTADDHATTCNTTRPSSAVDLVLTGSRAACRSSWGAFDMIGNAQEWVADWVTLAEQCNASWLADDFACVGAPSQPGVPGALVRGGGFLDGQGAGVFNVRGDFDPSSDDVGTGVPLRALMRGSPWTGALDESAAHSIQLLRRGVPGVQSGLETRAGGERRACPGR